MILEACVGSYKDAKEAELRGANRIELCENLFEGGTTPSFGTIKYCLANLNIPILVMIRPRGGDFNYSNDEIEIMKEDIKQCKILGVKGVVFGVLTEEEEIDYKLLEELVLLSKPMEITFHKAIDEIEDPVSAVKKLKKIGINRILTSGKEKTALEGKKVLNKMILEGNNEVIIVVAGGVTKENFLEVSKQIINDEYHGKKII